jgi:hypothetical protein
VLAALTGKSAAAFGKGKGAKGNRSLDKPTGHVTPVRG